MVSKGTDRSNELERAELQLADVLDEEGRDADGGGVQHRGVGEVVRREQLRQQRHGLVRVRVQLAGRARRAAAGAAAAAAAAAPRRVAGAAAAPLATVHYDKHCILQGFYSTKTNRRYRDNMEDTLGILVCSLAPQIDKYF